MSFVSVKMEAEKLFSLWHFPSKHIIANSYFFQHLTDAVNLLSLTKSSSSSDGNRRSRIRNARISLDEIAANINQVVDKNDFTIMFTIRSQVNACGIYTHKNIFTNTHRFTHADTQTRGRKTIYYRHKIAILSFFTLYFLW